MENHKDTLDRTLKREWDEDVNAFVFVVEEGPPRNYYNSPRRTELIGQIASQIEGLKYLRESR